MTENCVVELRRVLRDAGLEATFSPTPSTTIGERLRQRAASAVELSGQLCLILEEATTPPTQGCFFALPFLAGVGVGIFGAVVFITSDAKLSQHLSLLIDQYWPLFKTF